MYKKVFLFFCLAIVLCGIAGCGSELDPVNWTGDLTLYNDTSLTIDELYLAPTGDPSWGSNQLDSPLESGSSYTVYDLYPDNYDAMAVIVGTFSTYYGYIYNIPVILWQTYDLYAYDSDFSGSLKIVNDTAGAYIEEIYISPTSSGSWGSNQIDSSIGPADFVHLTDFSADDYDVKIVWDVGPDSVYLSNSVESLTLLTLNVN